MTTTRYVRFVGMGLAVAVTLAAVAIWWFDGAWEHGALPTHGMTLVLALAGCSLICFLVASRMARENEIAPGHTFHEDLNRTHSAETGSNRAFGVVFAVVFAVIGLFPLTNGGLPRWWALVLASVFLVAAVVAPNALTPLNRLWMRFGGLLQRIVTPVILGIVFFAVVTPIGILLRVLKKDVIPLKFEQDRKSFWIEREAG
ncbi:MAG: SxtJ family membrane protein, partial [Rhodospirillales bacterium]|nr:SxtJ family membrane protein [Rhodospirillales bacterium]